MKVFGKILKALAAILVIAAVVLIFWFGVFTASGNPEIPIPLPVGLLEPPDPSVAEHLYDTSIVSKDGIDYDVQFGFPLWTKESFVDGKFNKANATGYENKIPNFKDGFAIDYWDTTEDPFDVSMLEVAMYLFQIASYNESMVTNYAYYTEAGGSANLSAVQGMLMSQSIRWVNREFDSTTVGKFDESFFNQQVNALYKAKADATIEALAKSILNKAKRSMSYFDGQIADNYDFWDAFAPTFIESSDAEIKAEEAKYYEAFLAKSENTGNLTVGAGRCTADWESKVSRAMANSVNGKPGATDHSKYLGFGYDKDLSGEERREGYQKFGDVFHTKYEIPLDYDNAIKQFYGDDAQDDLLKPYVRKVWVDEHGNEVAESSEQAVRFYYDCRMTAIVNESEFSVNQSADNLQRLQWYTGANPGVKFTKLCYQFSVWDIGVLRHWHTLEGWHGTLAIIEGDVLPNNPTYYAYRKENTYMEDFVQYVVGKKRAETLYGITYSDDNMITYKNGVEVHNRNNDKNYLDKSKVKDVLDIPLNLLH